MNKTHRHRAITTRTATQGWSHCVAAGPCDGTAHGAVTFTEHCRCGAIRLTESNGQHQATSGWEKPE